MSTKQPTTEKESPPAISRFIVIIRPEFMTFCKDACRAAALNHLLFRIAYKSKDQPKEKIQAGEILWYAKTEQITSEMSDAWGTCKVRKEVNALIDMNLIGKKSNPTWGADRTKHFCFGKEQCARFVELCEENNICIVHLDLPVEVRHLIYLSNANDKSIKCSCSKGENVDANDKSIGCKSYIHQMETIDSSNANDKSIRAITKESIQKIDTKEDYEEEGTLPAHDHADSGATAPTAPSSQDRDATYEEAWEAYRRIEPNYARTNQMLANGEMPDLKTVDSYSHSPTEDTHEHTHDTTDPVVHPTRSTLSVENHTGDRRRDRAVPQETQATSERVAPAESAGYTQDDDTVKRPAVQLSTGAATSPQQRAKVERRSPAPARPAQSGRGKGKTSYQVYFSTEGAAFRAMYEEITGMQLDETAANARACNALGKKQGVDYDTIKAVQARIDADKWLSDHNIFVGVQELASDDGKWRWENWVRLVRKTKQAKQPPTRQQDPYSIAALLEEQNPGYHARKEANSWIN